MIIRIDYTKWDNAFFFFYYKLSKISLTHFKFIESYQSLVYQPVEVSINSKESLDLL